MSKNIIIQEGGIGKQLTVDKLKTDLVGGGSCLWVPEDGTQLGTKYISENGTYRASADGYYGYSEVTVSGVGAASGKDPDGSGDDATATVDPETGEIVITKQPSSIEVITPPTNPYGIYTDGQTITKDGMVVKAYYESGGEWGIVPIGEITINPTVAEYDESTDIYELELNGVKANGYAGRIQYRYPNSIACVFLGVYGSSEMPQTPEENPQIEIPLIYVTHTSTIFDLCLTEYNGDIYAASKPDISNLQINADKGLWAVTNIKKTFKAIAGPTASGYSALYEMAGHSVNDPTGINIDDMSKTQRGSIQTINVSWPRPGDGKVLETTFEILVAPPYSTEE